MNNTAPQPALREWRAHMNQPARLASFLGAAAILTLVGPFETDEVMRAAPRFAYWGVIVALSYTVGYFGNILADRLAGKHASLLHRVLIAAPLTAIGVLAVVYVLNGLAIGYWATGRELAIIAANVAIISSIITSIFYVADNSNAAATAQSAPPPLLDRLPFDKRAPLVSFSVEDHYVRIRTTKGEELVLMRLADAMREVGGTNGLHVHRSHWIATAHVTSATRKGDGATLSMAHGPDIPVSRANVSEIKEAGLLPRT